MTVQTTPTMETLFLLPDGVERNYRNVDVGATYAGYSPAAKVVARWHDETHEGVFRFCDEQPCHAVRSVDVP